MSGIDTSEELRHVIECLGAVGYACSESCVGFCNCSDEEERAKQIVKDMADAIVRVRDLHKPYDYEFFKGLCKTCSTCCDDVPYPCPTLRALDGEQA